MVTPLECTAPSIRPAPRLTPPAAKVLAASLDKLRSASTHGRRGRLALVRTMTKKGGA